jgi:hypothetical protein
MKAVNGNEENLRIAAFNPKDPNHTAQTSVSKKLPNAFGQHFPHHPLQITVFRRSFDLFQISSPAHLGKLHRAFLDRRKADYRNRIAPVSENPPHFQEQFPAGFSFFQKVVENQKVGKRGSRDIETKEILVGFEFFQVRVKTAQGIPHLDQVFFLIVDDGNFSGIFHDYAGETSGVFSHPSSHSFAGSPPANPCKPPSVPMTRWHGTNTGNGFFPIAVATARTALGLPIIAAICA